MISDLRVFFDGNSQPKIQRRGEYIDFSNGERVDIFNPKMTFQNWADRYAQDLRDHGNPMVPGLGILVSLMRPEERRQFSKSVGGTDWVRDAETSVQLAGAPDLVAADPQTLSAVDGFHGCGMVGTSSRMVALYKQTAILCNGIRQYPKVLPNIHITGEPGSGKELVAKTIHALTGRAGPLQTVLCSALPDNLFESELFGHEKGSFTGAIDPKVGILEQCDRGTVFLDEIHMLPNGQRAKLLRVLQERTIRRVGGNRDIPIDVVFVSACNVDLANEVMAGRFPRDLWERLKGEVIYVPALHEHPEDIPLLLKNFLGKFPNNPLDAYRFPLAYWCMEQVGAAGRLTTRESPKPTKGSLLKGFVGGSQKTRIPSGPISVRGLETLVGQLVREATPVQLEDNPRLADLRGACNSAIADGNTPPLSQATVAKYLKLAPQTLHDSRWKPHVDVVIREGRIKPRRKG